MKCNLPARPDKDGLVWFPHVHAPRPCFVAPKWPSCRTKIREIDDPSGKGHPSIEGKGGCGDGKQRIGGESHADGFELYTQKQDIVINIHDGFALFPQVRMWYLRDLHRHQAEASSPAPASEMPRVLKKASSKHLYLDLYLGFEYFDIMMCMMK